MNRRGFLGGLLSALAAPAIIRTPGLLMPVRPPLILAVQPLSHLGMHPALLWPGVKNWWGPAYQELEHQHGDLFDAA